MELPHQYSYNPRLRLILLVFGSGLLWMAVQWLSWGHMPTGFGLWFGVAPIALALVVFVRRILVERYLLLDNDSMVLPTGPFQMRTARIEYTSIKRVWQHYLPFKAVVLRVATEKHTFEIVSMLLADNESYRALEEFLSLKARENATRQTSQNT
jgi:hypothetical protein